MCLAERFAEDARPWKKISASQLVTSLKHRGTTVGSRNPAIAAIAKDDAPQVIHLGEHKKTISCMRDWAGGPLPLRQPVVKDSHVRYKMKHTNV